MQLRSDQDHNTGRGLRRFRLKPDLRSAGQRCGAAPPNRPSMTSCSMRCEAKVGCAGQSANSLHLHQCRLLVV